jgi:hypothetical protein
MWVMIIDAVCSCSSIAKLWHDKNAILIRLSRTIVVDSRALYYYNITDLFARF